MTLERKSNIIKFVSILLVLDKKHIIKIIKEVKKIPSIYDNQIIKGSISDLEILDLKISIIDIKRSLLIYHKISN